MHLQQRRREDAALRRGRAAQLYTLIETAKLNDIDPQAWLADMRAACPITRQSGSVSSCHEIGARTLPDRYRVRLPPWPPPDAYFMDAHLETLAAALRMTKGLNVPKVFG
jgi:hypothetical protein